MYQGRTRVHRHSNHTTRACAALLVVVGGPWQGSGAAPRWNWREIGSKGFRVTWQLLSTAWELVICIACTPCYSINGFVSKSVKFWLSIIVAHGMGKYYNTGTKLGLAREYRYTECGWQFNGTLLSLLFYKDMH